MSHAKERSERICLNCKADLLGRYCHACGQENREPKESVWGLITHFFYDITHFDGKFFSTLKYLAFKPGFLPAEYIKGRRASYLNPIRMYVFTSAIFFIIFFSVYNPENLMTDSRDKPGTDTAVKKDARQAAIDRALEFAHTKEDSAEILSGLATFTDTVAIDPADTAAQRKNKNGKGWNVNFTTDDERYSSIEEYDSVQKSLPREKRHGYFKRLMYKRQIAIQQKYGDNDKELMRAWLNGFIHQFPKLLFVSLPIFALILWLLYIRRRRQFFYVDHGIYSIHLYIFSFILLLVAMGIGGLSNWTGWGWLNWLQLPVWLYSLYYIYKSMRVFYKQGRGKTIVKFLLLNLLAFITIIFLFVVFFLLTAFQL